VLLARRETTTFLVDKPWREFVSPKPDTTEVARIAGDFRASHYAIKVALRDLFLSDAFWDARNRGTLVKGPVELIVGGGLYGAEPALAQLSTDGNLAAAIDFRNVYATALERWWGLDSRGVLGGRFTTLPIIRT